MEWNRRNLSILIPILVSVIIIPAFAVITIPSAPTNLFASLGLSTISVNLSWLDGANGGSAIIGHYIYRNYTNTLFGNAPLFGNPPERSYLKFDGNVTTLGVTNNNQTDYGTFHNLANNTGHFNTNSTGVVATAVRFDGSSSYFTFQHPSNYLMERTNSWTICFDYQRSPALSLANEELISKQTGPTGVQSPGVSLWIDGVALNIDLLNTVTTNELRVRDIASSDLINTGAWKNYCVTYNGASNPNSVKLYINGINKTSNLSTVANTLTSTIANGNPLRIGADGVGTSQLRGQIDEFRFYDSVISFSKIQQIANFGLYGNTQPYTDSGLISGQSYQYGISAVNVVGESPMSNTVSIIAAAPAPTNINSTNNLIAPITFSRTDPNSTLTKLNVTRPSTYDLTCSVFYEFANINKTYTHLVNNSSPTSGYVFTPFIIKNSTKDLITFYCVDSNTGNKARYELTQTYTNTPLYQQVLNFRNGVYGTQGYIGTLDLVTLIVLIIAMVGLNRVNETVGMIFMAFIIGALAVFKIVDWNVIITASVALAMMVTVITTRKLAYS